MNFLSPYFLAALAAVAVPLLIHIFSRRRLPEVPFSTLRFLRRSDRRSMRRIKFRRLLLLVLRMAAVALVALAFARPVVRGGLAALFPAGGTRAAAVLIDRSYSMGVEEDEGVLFERAKVRLEGILDNLDRDDEVSVLLFDTSFETVYEGGRLEREVIMRSLGEAALSWRGTDLRNAVKRGREVLGASRRGVREMYMISDFQRTSLGARGVVEGEDEGARIRTYLVPVQPEPGTNVSIVTVLTPRVTLHTGELADVRVAMRNTSMDLGARFPFEALVEGRRIMEKEIEIPPGGVKEERIVFPLEDAGWIKGEVRKKKDRLPADDARFFVLHVREKLDVLLVSDDEGFYLEQALSPEESEGDISLEKRNWRGFTTSDLEKASVLVLGPGRGPLVEDIDLIGRFLESGGKVLVMVIPELKAVVRALSAYSPRVDFVSMEEGFVSLEEPRTVPPFLSPFDGEDMAALTRLRFRGAAVVRGVPERVVLLRLSNGAPFIWKEERGGGSVVFAAIDPRPEFGELVLSPFFLPLIQQIVLASWAGPPVGEGSIVGDPVIWYGTFTGEPVCILPDGTELKPEYTSDARGMHGDRILIPPIESPGYVSVHDGADLKGRLAVNPDCGKESDLAVMSAEEAADSLGIENYTVLEEGDLAAAIYATREGREISLPLLLAALVLFVAELTVAQSLREEGIP